MRFLGYSVARHRRSGWFAASDLPVERSFLRTNHANVVVSAFKAAENKSGWSVIRLQEIGGEAVPGVQVESAFKVIEAVYANTVEVPTTTKADLRSIRVKPWQTVTILARLQSAK